MTREEMIEALQDDGFRVLPAPTLSDKMESAWDWLIRAAQICHERLEMGGRLPRDEDRTRYKVEWHAQRIGEIARRMAESMEERAKDAAQ